MRRNTIVVASLLFFAAVGCGYLVVQFVSTKMFIGHQQSTTAELATWAQEYSTIDDANEAGRALEMLEYAQRYYVVGPGYSTNTEWDAKLETQRDTTICTISEALDAYIKSEGNSRGKNLKAAKEKALRGTRWEQ